MWTLGGKVRKIRGKNFFLVIILYRPPPVPAPVYPEAISHLLYKNTNYTVYTKKSERVMKALLQMHKLDIAPLMQAYEEK
jgi:hypothetical protein